MVADDVVGYASYKTEKWAKIYKTTQYANELWRDFKLAWRGGEPKATCRKDFFYALEIVFVVAEEEGDFFQPLELIPSFIV